MKIPIIPLASNAFAIATSSNPISSAIATTAPGNAAQAPAVGAAIITPIELFTSIKAVTYNIIRFNAPPFNNCPARIISSNFPH